MNFLTRMATVFYVTLVLFVACGIALFVSHLLRLEQVVDFLYIIYVDNTLRLIFGVLAGILLLKNFVYYRLLSASVRRDKMVAFDNPSGRVSVSLSALEDMVKRNVRRLPEVKDVKPDIFASKKGVQFKIRLHLFSEVNIPDITSKVQELVKKKVQEMIGLDQSIDVTIFVGKISPDGVKGKAVEEPQDPPATNVPFQGYRA